MMKHTRAIGFLERNRVGTCPDSVNRPDNDKPIIVRVIVIAVLNKDIAFVNVRNARTYVSGRMSLKRTQEYVRLRFVHDVIVGSGQYFTTRLGKCEHVNVKKDRPLGQPLEKALG